MTPAQKTLARHALGLDRPGRAQSYRNRYFAFPDSPNGKQWARMVADGDAEVVHDDSRASSIRFALTRQGAEAALDPGESLDPEDFPR
jgi:hypothetical protein